jgi:protein-disulfide isomerase
VPQIQAILKQYPANVRLFFKEFPLDFHPQAGIAAEAAVAAEKQGKFWAMHDAMYAHPDRLSRQDLIALARQIGLDTKRFEADLGSTDVREKVVRDVQDGDRAGVEGTPTLFINGQRYNGPLEASVLAPVLNAQLKKPSK